MMPTLEQINKINDLLLRWHSLGISPSSIVFSEKKGKPFILLIAEPIDDLYEARWYYINPEGTFEEEP